MYSNNKCFTTKDKSIITKDWESALPMVKKYKTLNLVNRLGPLVIGIYLKMSRMSEYYVPRYYIHNLCREFPAITVTLNFDGRMIYTYNHQSLYISEAENMRNHAYIPLEGDLLLDDIIRTYEKFFSITNSKQIVEYEDLALVAGWTKEKDKINYILNLVYNELKKWPEDRYFSNDGCFEKWFSNLEQRVWDGDELDRIYRAELQKHKLTKTIERKIII